MQLSFENLEFSHFEDEYGNKYHLNGHGCALGKISFIFNDGKIRFYIDRGFDTPNLDVNLRIIPKTVQLIEHDKMVSNSINNTPLADNDYNLPKIPLKPVKKEETIITPETFQGTIEPKINNQAFHMVIIEGSTNPPKEKHIGFNDAYLEALRLSAKENKAAYIVKALTKIEQAPFITQLK